MNGFTEEQLALYNAIRDDLRGIRNDVVESLEAAAKTRAAERTEDIKRFEAHVQRVEASAIADREHVAQTRAEDRIELAAFVEEVRDFQVIALRYIKGTERPEVRGSAPSITPFSQSPLARLVLRIADAFGAPLGTTRLVLAAALSLAILMTSLTACIVQAR